MRKKNLFSLVLFLSALFSYSQEINTDELYLQALQEYMAGNYSRSLNLSETALDVAPEYHDIRILKIRNLFALHQFEQIDKDLDLLLSNVPQYDGVKEIATRRLRQLKNEEALSYNERLLQLYNDKDLKIMRAQLLLNTGDKDKARELAI